MKSKKKAALIAAFTLGALLFAAVPWRMSGTGAAMIN